VVWRYARALLQFASGEFQRLNKKQLGLPGMEKNYKIRFDRKSR
jgi:hypothetical protein